MTLRPALAILNNDAIKTKGGDTFDPSQDVTDHQRYSWPLVPYFPKTIFGSYFYYGIVTDANSITYNYSFGGDEAITTTDADSRGESFLSADEKVLYCQDPTKTLFFENVDGVISKNACGISVNLDEVFWNIRK